MPKQHINPPGLAVPAGYTHLVTVSEGTLVFVAGQVAYDEHRTVVGEGDHLVQARKAFENLRTALAGAGATPSDVVKVNTYVVDYRPELLPGIGQVVREVMGYDPPPASTIVGVSGLAVPGLLIEVECMAVIP